MSASRVLVLSIVLVALAASTVSACSNTHPPRALKLGDWEDKLTLYLKAETSSSGPSLQRDASALSSTTQYMDASWGPSSGVAGAAGRMNGQNPAAVEFRTSGPLGGVHYLNLSKPVWGALFVSSTLGNAASRGDALDFRVEVYTGSQRVGGSEYLQPITGSRPAGWFQYNYCFRPEVTQLDANQPMTVKITRKAGSVDFMVGTADPKQSFLEIRYFATDPLEGALYVEKGKLIKGVGPQEDDEKGEAGLGLEAVPFLALVGLGMGVRRRGTLALAGLMLFAAVASGCLSDSSSTTATDAGGKAAPSPSVSYFDEDPKTKTAGRGSLEGLVLDETGLPLNNVHVALLGTNRFTTTGKDGRFSLPNLTARDYVVRVDAEGFTGSETRVVVEEGRVASVTFRLPYPEKDDKDAKPHIHDEWGEDKVKTLISKSMQPVWTVTTLLDTATTLTLPGDDPPSSVQPVGTETDKACSRHVTCRWVMPLEEGVVILPGTSLIELTWTWTGANSYKELGLFITTPFNRSMTQHFVPRGSGDTFRIAIFPTEADPGHQKFTDWAFTAILPPLPYQHPFGPPVEQTVPIQVKLVIHKGVVPFEPAHRDFWNGANELKLFTERQLGPSSCLTCDMPMAWGYDFRLPKDEFVPAETQLIKGTLRWTQVAGSTAALTPWNLLYRPANMPAWGAVYPQVTVDKRLGDRIEFSITPGDKEGDQYYQQASRWIFYLDDGDQPHKGVNSAYGTTWFLTATAYKTPPP
jgi:hypothetical protein